MHSGDSSHAEDDQERSRSAQNISQGKITMYKEEEVISMYFSITIFCLCLFLFWFPFLCFNWVSSKVVFTYILIDVYFKQEGEHYKEMLEDMIREDDERFMKFEQRASNQTIIR